jgi:peroxiredoxin
MSTPADTKRSYVNLTPGDPVPWFNGRLTGNVRYSFDKAAGRYVVLCFFVSAGDAAGKAAIAAVEAHRHLFDGEQAVFFGVTVDPGDESSGRVRESLPGIHHFWDFDFAISRAYGAVPTDCAAGEANITTRRFWLVVDPALRVLRSVSFSTDDTGAEAVFRFLETLPPVAAPYGLEMQAPVLLVPNVFEPDVCRTLIDTYEANGGIESGFMREIDGKTAVVHDPVHKRRRDFNLEDMQLIESLKSRVHRRIVPEIARAHQFHVTRMERFLVACYSAEEEGHFNPHRDNTTKGTAHRRFAVSLNLNDDYDGGELWFPEYGPRTFKPPPGGAVVFSCSLLHAATLVTRGRRYVFLPFLYDEAAAALRLENNKYLDASVGQYRR